MLRLIEMEIFKLKRSKIFLIGICGAAIAPILNFLVFLSYTREFADKAIALEKYYSHTLTFLSILIATLLFGLIATYIFNREHQENTLKNILTIPIGRTAFIISKTIILYGWIISTMIITFLLTTLFGITGIFIEVNKDVIINFMKIYLLCGNLIFLLTPVIILITLIFKSYVPSIATSIFLTFMGVVIVNTKFEAFFPWTAIYVIINNTINTQGFELYPWIAILATFILSYGGCIIYINRADVH